jgi:PhoH-like ATPase
MVTPNEQKACLIGILDEFKKQLPNLRSNRIFVLDTNVLLHDARSLFAFNGVIVAIPFVVLEELDKFKKDTGERGRNAREVIRTLDGLRAQGCLSAGVVLKESQAVLKVFQNPPSIPFEDEAHAFALNDNLIIQTVHNLVDEGNIVTLVSKDINARVKADALGLEAEDYTKGTISYESFYKGWRRLPIPALDLKNLTPKKIRQYMPNLEIWPNEFIIFESENNPENYRLFRYLNTNEFKEVVNIDILRSFRAKNLQQLMTLDLLMDDNVKLVTLLGQAGTGKTFLALLVGLYKVATLHQYRRLLVTRPVIALGADIGYLPGEVQEKLRYWMQPVYDNIEFIYSELKKNNQDFFPIDQKKKKFEQPLPQNFHAESHVIERLTQKGVLSLEAITYMRGRSIPYQFLFIDEVQNLTPHEVKTIVSRAGEGTKVILAGDPYQIDSPFLDFTSNGLTVTTEKLKEEGIFGSVFLETSERSELAKVAAEKL